MQRALPFLRVAAVAALLLVVVYVIALGTDPGRQADLNAITSGSGGPDWGRIYQTTNRIVHTIDIGSLAVAVVAIVALALARDRPAHALATFTVILGSVGTCEILKPALRFVDPLGWDTQRDMSGTFPSGHSSVAMSVTLGLIIAAPPAWRPAATVVSAGYSAAVGIGLVLLGVHFPSDVVGAFLVTCAWGALVCAWLSQRGELAAESDGGREYRRVGALAPLIVGAAALVFAGFVVAALHSTDFHRLGIASRLHTSLIASCVGIGVLAVGVPALLSWLLYAEARRGATSPA